MKYSIDIKLQNNEILEGVYFIKYKQAIRGGRGSPLLAYMDSEIKAFDKLHNEIINVNFENSEIMKVYDAENNEDITDETLEILQKFRKQGVCLDVSWLIQETRYEDSVLH